ncbi:MAG: ribosome modulation factor [Magnetospiraceae bacterium]
MSQRAEEAKYAHAEGRQAFRNGVEACPYQSGTSSYSAWWRGWRSAKLQAQASQAEEAA